MKTDLLRSLAIATTFSVVILLLIAISEQLGFQELLAYAAIFVVVPYGLTLLVAGTGADTTLPVLLEWFVFLPTMVAFYWPIALLGFVVSRGVWTARVQHGTRIC